MINLDRTWRMMEENRLEALIASSPQNVFYTGGFLYHGAAGNRIFFLLRNIGPAFTILQKGREPVLLLPNSGKATAERYCFFKDQRFYGISFPPDLRSPSQGQKATFSALQALKEILTKLGVTSGRMGVEGLDLPVNFYLGLREFFPKLEMVDSQDLFSRLRAIKGQDEVERVRQATLLAAKGLEKAYSAIREGASEREILNAYKEEVTHQGGMWCNTKFCAGRVNGATISHQPSDYRILPGDPAIFDVGAIYEGYTTDLARVGYLGKVEEEGAKLYRVLRSAQEKAIAAMRPGVAISEVFNVAQNHVRESGYPKYTRTNIGHGVGVDFEEEPFIAPESDWKIEKGMTLAVEIPFYSAELGGFNIEDVVFIGERGVEVFSSSLSKELQIFG